MKLDAIYALTSQNSAHLAARRFPLTEWRVYEAIAAGTGSLTARALAQQLGIAPEGMADILDQLHGAGLIHIPEMSYEEFKAITTPASADVPGHELRSSAAVPLGSEPHPKVSFALRRPPRSSVSPIRKEGPLKLGRLVHLVRERSGGGSLGQLAVYRLFLKIPSELLQAADLEQFDLDATDVEINHPQLANALREKACELLEVPPQELAALLDG